MGRGRAVDEGTHEELLARGGIYADLYRLQFRDGKSVVDREGTRALQPRPENVRPEGGSGFLGRLRRFFTA